MMRSLKQPINPCCRTAVHSPGGIGISEKGGPRPPTYMLPSNSRLFDPSGTHGM